MDGMVTPVGPTSGELARRQPYLQSDTRSYLGFPSFFHHLRMGAPCQIQLNYVLIAPSGVHRTQ